MNKFFTTLGILVWIPPLIVVLYYAVSAGGIGGLGIGIIVGIMIAFGEFVVLAVFCMILEWIHDDDDPNN
jgi:hypothetical protein